MNDKNSNEKKITDHQAEEDPSGLAIRCSCGGWSMLYNNSFGLDATAEHQRHVAKSI
jgi:hypothetical protein